VRTRADVPASSAVKMRGVFEASSFAPVSRCSHLAAGKAGTSSRGRSGPGWTGTWPTALTRCVLRPVAPTRQGTRLTARRLTRVRRGQASGRLADMRFSGTFEHLPELATSSLVWVRAARCLLLCLSARACSSVLLPLVWGTGRSSHTLLLLQAVSKQWPLACRRRRYSPVSWCTVTEPAGQPAAAAPPERGDCAGRQASGPRTRHRRGAGLV